MEEKERQNVGASSERVTRCDEISGRLLHARMVKYEGWLFLLQVF